MFHKQYEGNMHISVMASARQIPMLSIESKRFLYKWPIANNYFGHFN